jgi:hypothetical protein
MVMTFYLFRFTWMISSLVALLKFSENYGEGVPDVHDGRTKIFLRYQSEADEAKHLLALIKR